MGLRGPTFWSLLAPEAAAPSSRLRLYISHSVAFRAEAERTHFGCGSLERKALFKESASSGSELHPGREIVKQEEGAGEATVLSNCILTLRVKQGGPVGEWAVSRAPGFTVSNSFS